MPTIQFKGKSFVQNHHLTVKYHQLLPRPAVGLSPLPALDDNLVIHGDNLLVLKALLPNYAGRVKCIYIDPPYNTGNEGWRYNDKVNSPMMQKWFSENPVNKDDLLRHDKWLCMMMPRLALMRELLRDDGVIFISIDDNEVHHLRALMDIVFGEENFLATIIWNSKYTTSNDAKGFSNQHEYILCYSHKNGEGIITPLARTAEMDAAYRNPDDDSRGVWKPTPLHAKSGSKNYVFRFNKNGRTWTAPDGRWPRYSQDRLRQLEEDNRIWFGNDGNAVPNVKTFLFEVKQGKTPGSVWKYDEVGHTHSANEQVAEIFGKGIFENPKPVGLIKRCLELTTSEDDIVLDAFAGSGTTGQAVLELNTEDEGNRRFVLIEQEDYAESLTAERLRRVIKGVPKAKNPQLQAGLGGTFSYFELGSSLDPQDLLEGDQLPSFEELARFLFYTATGEQFDPAKMQPQGPYIGESSKFVAYLLYRPDKDFLRSNESALTLVNQAELPTKAGKQRLVFAPAKFLSGQDLENFDIKFVRLPHEISRHQQQYEPPDEN